MEARQLEGLKVRLERRAPPIKQNKSLIDLLYAEGRIHEHWQLHSSPKVGEQIKKLGFKHKCLPLGQILKSTMTYIICTSEGL